MNCTSHDCTGELIIATWINDSKSFPSRYLQRFAMNSTAYLGHPSYRVCWDRSSKIARSIQNSQSHPWPTSHLQILSALQERDQSFVSSTFFIVILILVIFSTVLSVHIHNNYKYGHIIENVSLWSARDVSPATGYIQRHDNTACTLTWSYMQHLHDAADDQLLLWWLVGFILLRTSNGMTTQYDGEGVV